LAVILFLNRRLTKTLMVLTVLIAAVFEASAGSPRHIAGTVSFEPAAKGTPLTWADGTVTHYTDRGAFSPILSEAAADALVAKRLQPLDLHFNRRDCGQAGRAA
jgi:hypothetical protein